MQLSSTQPYLVSTFTDCASPNLDHQWVFQFLWLRVLLHAIVRSESIHYPISRNVAIERLFFAGCEVSMPRNPNTAVRFHALTRFRGVPGSEVFSLHKVSLPFGERSQARVQEASNVV